MVAGLTFAVAGTTSNASAGVIHPVFASTSDTVLFGDVANLIDGTINVDENVGIGSAVSGTFGGPYSLSFDLGADFDLTGMSLWNNAGNIDMDGEGINAFTLRFLDASGGTVSTYSAVAMDVLTEQTFSFSVQGVRRVDLVIESNHAPTIRNYAALHEVAFIPSPGVLCTAVLCAMVGGSRRRRTDVPSRQSPAARNYDAESK